MRRVPFSESIRTIARGVNNWYSERPIVISFEVTDSCTCYCKHCDHGGPRDNSRNLKPADYRRYMEALRPCAVQISGGEPLMREDLLEIVRNIKTPDGLPYLILVSNWSGMTEEKYLRLHEAGINQFSVSLDFPDQRHNDFRGYPGLFEKLDKIVPKLATYGFDDIVINNCITRHNLPYINAIADKARDWGVNVSYSAYTFRRTQCWDHFIDQPAELAELEDQLKRIKARMADNHWIVNSCATLDATLDYFQKGGTPGCKAGSRFLVVTSDGYLQPCSMQFKRYRLGERRRLIEEFTKTNTCDECYVSIRSYLDKTLPRLFSEMVGGHLSFKGRHNGKGSC
ncbi:MAG TPA: radical SAM protein [Terriglobia bacterium]|nr:radical SAM protein [Terriglobia bacterium]